MNQLFKNRAVIAAISLAMALILGVAYYASVQVAAQKTEVVTVTGNIPKGTKITADMVTVDEVGGYGLAQNAVRKTSDVIGCYALADFTDGDLILQDKLSKESPAATDPLRYLDGSESVISVGIDDLADGVSDKLMSGDIVSCYVTQNGKTTLPPELTYLQVVAVTDPNGVDKQTEEPTGDENMATVTLLANQQQAALLANYDAAAQLHFALVYRGDDENAAQFLEKQAEAF